MLKIAERWHERRRISDEITLIWEPHVHSFLRCNIWHVRGRDADLLVDTGLGVASLKDAIADLIDKPLIALATHIHYDHVGCLHEFDQRVMHAIEAPRMADYDEFTYLKAADFPAEWQEMLAEDGFGELLVNAAPDEDFTVDDYRITSTQPTRTVQASDEIDLGNRHFEVMHLPGHSPGSICLTVEGDRPVLIAGDTLFSRSVGRSDLWGGDATQLVDSIQRKLFALPDETLVICGHGPSTTIGEERRLNPFVGGA
jgi:glyoxylase-like metal-dependent hydrolase (beta-lactamase superfamily II)